MSMHRDPFMASMAGPPTAGFASPVQAGRDVAASHMTVIGSQMMEAAKTWPHLKELATSCNSDWLLADFKFGNFSGTTLPEFEPQTYDGDGDLARPEAFAHGRQLSGERGGASWNGHERHRSNELASSSVFRYGETPEDGEPALGHSNHKISAAVGPLQLHLLQAYDPLFSWQTESAAMAGGRLPVMPPLPAAGAAVRFAVAITKLELEAGAIEPMYGSLALWDFARHEKLSEDFYWQFTPQDWMASTLGANERRCVLAIAEAEVSPSVGVLVQIERTATNDAGGVKSQLYTHPKKEIGRSNDKELIKLQQAAQDWSQKMPVKEQFAWAVVQLFGPAGPICKVGEERTVDVAPLHRIKECYTDHALQDLISDPKRKMHKPVRARCEMLVQRLPDELVVVASASNGVAAGAGGGAGAGSGHSRCPSDSSANGAQDAADDASDKGSYGADGPAEVSESPLGRGRGSALIAVEPRSRYQLVPAAGAARSFHLPGGHKTLVNFRLLGGSQPHTSLFHYLYVYPQSFVTKKSRNVYVKVEMRDDDINFSNQGLPVFVGRDARGSIRSAALTQVAWQSKICLFHDEFKLIVPPALDRRHHLLFTFVQIDVPSKSDAQAPQKIIGYAAVPLFPPERVTSADISLPVMSELMYKYLEENVKANMPYLEERKLLFRLRLRLCSSINPTDEHLSYFFHSYDAFVAAGFPPYQAGTFEMALQAVSNASTRALVQFVFPVLTMLLRIIAVCDQSSSLRLAAFRAMVHVCKRVQAGDDASERSPHLAQFTDFIYGAGDRSGTPPYAALLDVWCALIVGKTPGKSADYEDALAVAWLLLELIVKSIAIELESRRQREDSAKSTVSILSPEVYGDLQTVFGVLLNEAVDRSTSAFAAAAKLNASLAFLCADLLQLIHPEQSLRLVEGYFARLAGSCTPVLHDLKLAFLRIICDADNVASFITPDGRRNHLINRLLVETLIALDHPERTIRRTAARDLARVVTKFEHDARFQWGEDKTAIASFFYPLLEALLEQRGQAHLLDHLTAVERREVLVCVLFVLRSAQAATLADCYTGDPDKIAGLFAVLRSCLASFEYHPSGGASGADRAPGHGAPPKAEAAAITAGNLSPSTYDVVAADRTGSRSDWERLYPALASRGHLHQSARVMRECIEPLRRLRLHRSKGLGGGAAPAGSGAAPRGNPMRELSWLRRKLRLWEASLCTCASLIVLDAFVMFLDGPDRIQEEPDDLKPDDVRLDCLCSLLVDFFGRHQSVAALDEGLRVLDLFLLGNRRHVFQVQASRAPEIPAVSAPQLQKQPSAGAIGHAAAAPASASPPAARPPPPSSLFLEDICLSLLRLSASAVDGVQKVGVDGLRQLLRHSYAVYGSAQRLGVSLTLALARLLESFKLLDGTGGVVQESAFARCLKHALERVVTDVGLRECLDPSSVDGGAAPAGASRSAAGQVRDELERREVEVEGIFKRLREIVARTLAHDREAHRMPSTTSTRTPVDRFALVDHYCALAEAYAHVPDLFISWMQRLWAQHKEEGRWAEAAMCAVSIFLAIQLWMSQHSTRRRPSYDRSSAGSVVLPVASTAAWSEDNLATVRRICPLTGPLGCVRPLPESCVGLGSSQATLESGMKWLHAAIKLFLLAEMHAYCVDLYEMLVPIYKARRDYGRLIECYDGLKLVYESLSRGPAAAMPVVVAAVNGGPHGPQAAAQQAQAAAHEGGSKVAPHGSIAVFFRVAFFGDDFGADLDGKQYIYREPRSVSQAEFIERLRKLFIGKIAPSASLKFITDGQPINNSELLPHVCYIQASRVEPIRERAVPVGRRRGGTPAPASSEGAEDDISVNQFVFDYVHSAAGVSSSAGSIQTQWRRRSTFVTESTFPSICSRLSVTDWKEVELSPIENARDSILEQTSGIRYLADRPQGGGAALHRMLAATVRVHQSQGLIPVCRAFLGPESRGDYSKEQVGELEDAICELVGVCSAAILAEGLGVAAESRPAHEDLVRALRELVLELAYYNLPPPPNFRSL